MEGIFERNRPSTRQSSFQNGVLGSSSPAEPMFLSGAQAVKSVSSSSSSRFGSPMTIMSESMNAICRHRFASALPAA
jgi:hypothetical protein